VGIVNKMAVNFRMRIGTIFLSRSHGLAKESQSPDFRVPGGFDFWRRPP
jgi:hypothetical protein